MKGSFDLRYIDGRLLFVVYVEGGPANIADLLVDDSDELDQAIGMVMRATRKQLVQMVAAGVH